MLERFVKEGKRIAGFSFKGVINAAVRRFTRPGVNGISGLTGGKAYP